jgi:hypothetical protein
MASNANILDELIKQGETITGKDDSFYVTPTQSQTQQPSSETKPLSRFPSLPEKFDETIVLCVLSVVAVFLIMRIFFRNWFVREDEFGDPVFSKKKYIGVCILFSLPVAGLVWYYHKKYYKRGVKFSISGGDN